MTVINTNVGALMARTYAATSAQRTETSMERLSSGLRINGAADDAAGLAVANKMQSQLKGIKMAVRNSQDGISLVQTAESGMGEISNMILRMRELAVQMENGIYTSKDRDNAQLEVNALLQEIDKIASNTRFNDVKLLDGAYDQTIRAGNTNAETIRVSIDALSTASTAKLANYAVEKAAAAAISANTANAETLTINTIKAADQFQIEVASLATDVFKDKFKTDALGVFSISGGAQAALYDIDTKTGRLTSKAAVAAAASHAVEVTYAARTGSGVADHVFTLAVTAAAATASTLAGIEVETTA